MKVLFIRRDNIGDLICTTPAIHAVREAYPDAKIGILVNTYNRDAVIHNEDIDEIYAYEKAKHAAGKSKTSVWLSNMKLLRKIRKEQYDIAIGCGSYSPRLSMYTFFTGAGKRVGYLPDVRPGFPYYNLPVTEPSQRLHEVEKVFNLLKPLGIASEPGRLRISPDAGHVGRALSYLRSKNVGEGRPLISCHISSRRPENRWGAERFVELIKMASRAYGSRVVLLWSPGTEDNVYHPGDDEKAEYVTGRCGDECVAYRTSRLRELVAVLSLCDLVVCCDGGGMHIAAALGKPIVAIWGSTDPDMWRPWSTKYAIIQGEGKSVEHVSVEQVFAGIGALLGSPR